MANQEHLDILTQGVKIWNEWRKEYPKTQPDLSEACLHHAKLNSIDLSGTNLRYAHLFDADFTGANLSRADLTGADLNKAKLFDANLSFSYLVRTTIFDADLGGADLSSAYLNYSYLSVSDFRGVSLTGATLYKADLSNAFLTEANLIEANLTEANLTGTDLTGTDLTGAKLSGAILVKTNLTNTRLKGCNIYGISTWDVQLDGAEQFNLTITPEDHPTITVDNLKIAQFIYLLLNNEEIRDVIDTIARKAVLILGRFTPDRKAILDALREVLRAHGYVPILFDFDKPSSQDLTETVSTLAHLSRFIVVDLTDPSSAPYEVGTIASNHIKPIQAIFHPSDEAKRVFAMFPDLVRRYHWVLPPFEYKDQAHLLAALNEHVIEPAEQKVQELEKR